MELSEFADHLLDDVRSLLLQHWRHPLISERKKDASIVTEADRKTEMLIRERIKTAFPDHGILGEEFGAKAPDANMLWVIDPIDGTLSFARGLPLFGCLLACYRDGQQIFGAIEMPALDERYTASVAGELLLNGNLFTAEHHSSEEPMIATGDDSWFRDAGMDGFLTALQQQYFCRTLPDCFGHTLALRGAVDALVDVNLNYWDIAASPLLFAKAGKAFEVVGKRKINGITKYDIICGDPVWVQKLMALQKTTSPIR